MATPKPGSCRRCRRRCRGLEGVRDRPRRVFPSPDEDVRASGKAGPFHPDQPFGSAGEELLRAVAPQEGHSG
jgi:hypothetical protein